MAYIRIFKLLGSKKAERANYYSDSFSKLWVKEETSLDFLVLMINASRIHLSKIHQWFSVESPKYCLTVSWCTIIQKENDAISVI